MIQWYIRESTARDVHLGLRNQPSTFGDTKFLSFAIYADRCHTMSIGKEQVEELIKTNNDKLLDSFKGLLEQTVSQIKRSNEESAESQMKEIKRTL